MWEHSVPGTHEREWRSSNESLQDCSLWLRTSSQCSSSERSSGVVEQEHRAGATEARGGELEPTRAVTILVPRRGGQTIPQQAVWFLYQPSNSTPDYADWSKCVLDWLEQKATCSHMVLFGIVCPPLVQQLWKQELWLCWYSLYVDGK